MALTNPERWKQIEALYHAASDASEEERQALFSTADPDTRLAVDAMLRQSLVEEAVLDRPAWELEGGDPGVRPALTPGAQIGPYRVDGLIGGGGMGDVYRATDVRLNRTVAIKVSAAEFSARFEREARAVAALNHPNICQIYDIGPHMLIMEYVVGTPVVSPETGTLALRETLELALQVVAAIEAAHAKGIVHRDLKPANILVTDARIVKLLDFGIAKRTAVDARPVAETANVTQAGFFLGTPAYMSPEAAEGKPADARSDIFSFGAILYEMLSGNRAFPGESVASTLGAVLHRAPDPLHAPPALNAIVSRCLAKDPADRFQTAIALRAALERASITQHEPTLLQRALPGGRRRFAVGCAVLLLAAAVGAYTWVRNRSTRVGAIAVLPLDMQSNEPEAGYISDGIADSISNRLSRVSGLRVTPNSIAQQYKGQAANFHRLADELGIDAVLSGRVVQHGDDLTINVELNDVRHGNQLWGQQYVRKVADLLAVQNDIAKEVSQRLRSGLSAQDQQQIAAGSTANAEAYQFYLKGAYYTDKFTRDGFGKGIDYLNQAIVLDPNYADAYGYLAYNYINQDDWFLAPKDSAPKARAAALKALSLEETDVDAHVVLAIENNWYEWDWDAADREFRRAIELDPGSGDARGYYSWFLPSMGRDDEAVAQARESMKRYPLSYGANGNLGSVFVFTQRWDEAILQLRSAIDLYPDYWFDYLFLGRAYEQKANPTEAVETFRKGLQLEDNTELWAGLGHALAVSGKREEALKVLEHLDELSKHRYVAPYNFALVHVGLGQNDQAFEWLERAYQARSYLLAIYLNTDARLRPIYGDSRYEDLLHRVRLLPPREMRKRSG